ncbi:MAG TPA: hypothetical protein VN176_08415, partial [Verrucomicrobiae bacterium]|nr:hypothetical protein [Verrucomicrobiae bacterium]
MVRRIGSTFSFLSQLAIVCLVASCLAASGLAQGAQTPSTQPQSTQRPQTSSATPGNLDGLDAFMEKAMRDFKVPGAAVAVVRDGKILF